MMADLPAGLLLAADDSTLRWHNLPPAWVVALLVVPALATLVWLAYRRERASPRQLLVLATLRLLVVLAAVALLFGPYLEHTLTRKVRSHVVVLLDTSSSMDVADEVDPTYAAELARASGIATDRIGATSRFDLARAAMLAGGNDSFLERLRDKFVVHLYSFAADSRTVWSGDEDRPDTDPAAEAATALASLRPDGPSTRLGDAVLAALEDFRLRDEQPLAGIIVVSDGRNTGGLRTPREAGEVARQFLPRGPAAVRGVPVHAVLAGDPSSARNVQVRNLVAPEVVLANDDATFEFDVVEKGFDDQDGTLRIRFIDPAGENDVLAPGRVTMRPGEAGVRVKSRYRFSRPGNYALRVGVVPMTGESVEEDNWLDHHVRVVDRKVRVLYVDGRPRREWEALQRALTRDSDTMLVHTLQMESAREVPQPRTVAPGWPPLPGNLFPRSRAELFEYDVVVMGDADWRDLDDTEEDALHRLQDLRDFVEAGGGVLFLAGEYYMPLAYRRTAVEELLPVVVDSEELLRARVDTGESFNLALTPEGRESPILRIADDGNQSARLWESVSRWRQYWYFPALRAAAGARVLAVHPRGIEEASRGEEGRHANRYGPHVLMAAKTFGLGRTLWVGTDELWRMRYGVGDQFYYDFYAKAVRYLAAYRLLGGNKRVKIHPERQTYYVDEPVTIVGHVVGEDYRPPSPLEKPSVRVTLTLPDRREESLELFPVPLAPGEPPRGEYRATFTAAHEGTWIVAPDPSEVPGETPEEKSFQVQSSQEERKDPSVDEESMRSMATASGGAPHLLGAIASVPDALKARDIRVPVEARPEPLSDRWWVPVLLTAALALEWILRKRWRLL